MSPLNNLNSFHCIIIKLYENVCWQNISAKFDNQLDPIKLFGVMALELAKIAKINLSRSVTWIFFNESSLTFVKMFVGKISGPCVTTSRIPLSTLELWPLNYPNYQSKPYPLCNLNIFQWIIIKCLTLSALTWLLLITRVFKQRVFGWI